MQEGFELPSRTGGRLQLVRSRSATELLSGARIWAEGSAGSTTRFPPRRFLWLLAGTSGPGSGDLRDQLSGPRSRPVTAVNSLAVGFPWLSLGGGHLLVERVGVGLVVLDSVE